MADDSGGDPPGNADAHSGRHVMVSASLHPHATSAARACERASPAGSERSCSNLMLVPIASCRYDPPVSAGGHDDTPRRFACFGGDRRPGSGGARAGRGRASPRRRPLRDGSGRIGSRRGGRPSRGGAARDGSSRDGPAAGGSPAAEARPAAASLEAAAPREGRAALVVPSRPLPSRAVPSPGAPSRPRRAGMALDASAAHRVGAGVRQRGAGSAPLARAGERAPAPTATAAPPTGSVARERAPIALSGRDLQGVILRA